MLTPGGTSQILLALCAQKVLDLVFFQDNQIHGQER